MKEHVRVLVGREMGLLHSQWAGYKRGILSTPPNKRDYRCAFAWRLLVLPRGAGLWNHLGSCRNICVQQTITSVTDSDCEFAYICISMTSFTGL